VVEELEKDDVVLNSIMTNISAKHEGVIVSVETMDNAIYHKVRDFEVLAWGLGD